MSHTVSITASHCAKVPFGAHCSAHGQDTWSLKRVLFHDMFAIQQRKELLAPGGTYAVCGLAAAIGVPAAHQSVSSVVDSIHSATWPRM